MQRTTSCRRLLSARSNFESFESKLAVVEGQQEAGALLELDPPPQCRTELDCSDWPGRAAAPPPLAGSSALSACNCCPGHVAPKQDPSAIPLKMATLGAPPPPPYQPPPLPPSQSPALPAAAAPAGAPPSPPPVPPPPPPVDGATAPAPPTARQSSSSGQRARRPILVARLVPPTAMPATPADGRSEVRPRALQARACRAGPFNLMLTLRASCTHPAAWLSSGG